jgi:hypothetical protein
MATQTIQAIAHPKWMQYVLLDDGLVCVVLGAGCILGNQPLATATGMPALFLIFLGAVTLGYGAFALTVSRTLTRKNVLVCVEVNALSLVACLALLAIDVFPLTTAGRIILVVLAFAVAAYAIAEYQVWRRL